MDATKKPFELLYMYGLIIFPTYFTLQIFINIQTRQYRTPPCPACLAKRKPIPLRWRRDPGRRKSLEDAHPRIGIS